MSGVRGLGFGVCGLRSRVSGSDMREVQAHCASNSGREAFSISRTVRTCQLALQVMVALTVMVAFQVER